MKIGATTMAIDPDEIIWAPLPVLLPRSMPVHFERAIPGYMNGGLLSGEMRLNELDLKAVVVASTYVGALMAVFEQPLYKWSEVTQKGVNAAPMGSSERDASIWNAAGQLRGSVRGVEGIDDSERRRAEDLIDSWDSCRVLREDTDLDEWLMIEWSNGLFGRQETRAHSAVQNLIRYCLTIRRTCSRYRLAWDDRLPQVDLDSFRR